MPNGVPAGRHKLNPPKIFIGLGFSWNLTGLNWDLMLFNGMFTTSRGDLACKSTALTFEHDPNFSNANDFDKTGQNGVQVEGWSSKFRRSTKHHETNKWAQLATSRWTSMNIDKPNQFFEGSYFTMAWLFWGWGPHAARQLCGNGHTNRRLVQGSKPMTCAS